MIESTEDVDKLKNSTLEIIAGDLTKIFKENSQRIAKVKNRFFTASVFKTGS